MTRSLALPLACSESSQLPSLYAGPAPSPFRSHLLRGVGRKGGAEELRQKRQTRSQNEASVILCEALGHGVWRSTGQDPEEGGPGTC